MITEQTTNTVQSTMMGESVTMGIRSEDMAHIMDVLAGLYQNRLGAVIREYSTNALDAHIEAGFSGPVEVALPSLLDPTFRVRDYGLGLDRQGIVEVYSQYGRSTKRGSNDQVGMLGLGSKCALSYGQGFTVVSVKDGRRLTVLVSMDEEGAGQMQILGNPKGEPTKDANGTEIQVAIRREDIPRAERQAADFFAYWERGTVLVNGKEPKHFTDRHTTLRLSDDLFIVQDGGNGDRIVMGSVAYPQSINVNVDRRNWSLVAIVPIGSVKPAPSREGLKDVASTQATLKQLSLTFAQRISGAIQREVDKAATPADAVQTVIEWAAYLPGSGNAASYNYKGSTLPAVFTPQAQSTFEQDRWGRSIETLPLESTTFRDSYKKSQTYRSRDWPIEKWPGTIWVYDFAPTTFTAQHKNKLRKWCEQNNIGGDASTHGYFVQDGTVQNFVLLREAKPSNPFIADNRCVSWETVKKIQLQPTRRATGGGARIPGSYDVVTEDGFKAGVPGTELRTGAPLFWVHGNRYSGQSYTDALSVLYAKFTIVCLSENRINKWKRDVPASEDVREGIKAACDHWVKSLTLDQKMGLTYRLQSGSIVATLAAVPAGAKDPELQAARRICKQNTDKLNAQRRVFAGYINGEPWVVKGLKNPLDKYPLYNVHKAAHPHTVLYLNAAFDSKP